MNAWAQRWRDLGLTARLVGITLLLLLLMQAAVFWMVRGTITDKAREQIAAELAVGERVWVRLLEQNAEKLRQGAMLLASDYGFRTAVATGDEKTIQSALENHGQRIGAKVTALFSPQLELRAAGQYDQLYMMWLNSASYPTLEQPAPVAQDEAMVSNALQEVARQLAAQPQKKQLALVGRAPYQFVMVPMRAPDIIGWVLMGFPIDQALADDMFQLFSVHLAVTSAAPGEPSTVVVGTMPAADLPALAALDTQQTEIELQGQIFVARHVALETMRGQVRTVLLRSYSEVVAPFAQLQLLLGGLTLLGVALFGLASYTVTRRIIQPLKALEGVAQSIERGQYDVPVPHTLRADEVGQLARGFELMRASISAQHGAIRRLAYWDRLTGLPNRESFRQALRQAIAAQGGDGRPLAVITLNLDRFKHVNDVLGYAFGDQLLKAVAGRLQQQVQAQGQRVARLGGDEFAVLLPGHDAEGAMAMAARIAQAFEIPMAFDDQTVDLNAAMGVACWPADAADADTLMGRCEIAMHAAKSRTSGVMLYTPSLDSSSAQTLSLLSDLRQALQQGQLRLYLQPKVGLASGEVVAAEALVRWQHPQRGLVPPMQFIPFAEQTGFVRQLTLWIFEAAARQWALLPHGAERLRLSVNLSTRDLLDPDFPTRLAALLAQHSVPASAFCLEITESAIMDDPQRAEATLNKLAAQGFRLSIDDFGTGYSSLAYLKRLPVHELKIDKSFVMGMETDDSDAKIVRSTIDLAHNLGLSVVAEGVESAAILDHLRRLQCDEAQGYFMSRPMPADDFADWCARWRARPGA